VLLDTANALARPAWRASAVALIEHLEQRPDVQIIPLDVALWQRAWDLYRNRPEKGWSLTDCISFIVMQDAGLTDALTTDVHPPIAITTGPASRRPSSFGSILYSPPPA
jgi:predicted nucleic acid-binding protein